MSLRSHWEESRRGWIWATVICALTVTIVLGVQYQYQKSRLAKIESLSRDLGHAREDLANGFLHFSLGNTPDSPWQREQGIALLNQALDAYQRATVELTPVSDTAVPMQSQLADLRNQLHVFQVQDPGQQLPVDLKLRLSIYQLTQAAAKVDSETRIELSKLAEQQDWAFKITMGLSMVLLGAMCLGSYRVVTQSLAERRRNEEALRDNEQRWRFALEGAGDGVWDWNVANNTVHFSPRWKQMLGYDEADIGSSTEEAMKLMHPDDFESVVEEVQLALADVLKSYVNEHRMLCKDGTWKWVLDRGMVVSRDENGKALRMIGTHTDITERKEVEKLIWHQANFDSLTGLSNRASVREFLIQEVGRCRREGGMFAVLFVDLDHFKEVNDTLGHIKGDELLIEAAQRIRRCVQDDDWVSRQGGDEFTIVLARPTTVERIEAVANRLIEVLSERFTLGENQAFVSASIGITLYPNDADDVDGLFRNADQALYESKRSGRSCFSYFTPLLQESAQARMSMANDLRVALAEKQFYVAYQPIIELATGAIHKAEALVRWAHPVRGLISPADFIPIAESTGLIVEIGDWVFRQAAQQVKLWRQRYHPEFQISVNKSPVQFHQGHLIRQSWAEHLLELGLPGQALLVEITEGLLLDPRPEVIRHLRELRAHGIGASLDDFGTGYSSLSYLQKYDIDFVKIDQSFVRNLSQESKDLALCKAIVVMAHELGMKVIAEGVETELQFQMLLEAGCDYGQGYLFGRPVPADELDTLLAGPKRAAG